MKRRLEEGVTVVLMHKQHYKSEGVSVTSLYTAVMTFWRQILSGVGRCVFCEHAKVTVGL
jgi:hypothetical protein